MRHSECYVDRGPEFDLRISTIVIKDPNVLVDAMSSTLNAVERGLICKIVKIIPANALELMSSDT